MLSTRKWSRRSVRPIILAVIGWLATFCNPAMGQVKGHYRINGDDVNTGALDAAIIRMMDSVGVPGLSLAVFDNNGIVYYSVYGTKGTDKKKRVNRRTVFEACSLSKSLLAYVVHQLADQGRLDLDKPVWQYLPNQMLAHDARYKQITARMILGHCSGIENWMAQNNPDTLEIVSDPGKKFVYSGEAYNYLAKVIAHLLNKPYEQYMQEMVLKPLKMNRTFLRFRKNKMKIFGDHYPRNYATGSNSFGVENRKWINIESVPSSAVNLPAKDYAVLMTAMLNDQNLSPERRRALWQPMIRVNDHDTTLFLSEGFEVMCANGDTIIAHDGDNPGFKSALFYSVVSKKGFVFFSNSDRGILMAQRLSDLTVGLNISRIYESDYYRFYPNTAIGLFKIFREQGADAMVTEIEQLAAHGKLDEHTLNQLGDELLEYGETARKVVDIFLRLYPGSALANQLLGEIYLYKEEFDSSLVYLSKAASLAPQNEEIRMELAYCKKNLPLGDMQRRRALLTNVKEYGITTVQAEEYNAMYGVGTRNITDEGGGLGTTYMGTGHWLDYKVHVPLAGTYRMNFRLTSFPDDAKLEIRSDGKIVAAVNIPVTRWDSWITLSARMQLPAGPQVLRVYAAKGGADINWLQLAREADVAGTE